MLSVVLVHGGLYDGMNAQKFWADSGVIESLRAVGVDLVAPNRLRQPSSWKAEGDWLATAIEAGNRSGVAVVAGSNGCSAAVRLALDHAHLVERLMLCWPATAGDPVVDELARIIITDEKTEEAAQNLLAGEPLRGTTKSELAQLQMPCVIYPTIPENKLHRRRTVNALMESLGGAILLGGSPEPVAEEFTAFKDSFVRVIGEFAIVEDDD